MRHPVVLFDLDGTLTDPEIGICRSIQYALEKDGRPVGPLESYHPWIGPPLLWSFQTYAGASREEAIRLMGYYRERFSTVGLFENKVYPGIPELLSKLKEKGAVIAVATGKPSVFSRQILEHFDLARYIDFVSGISLDREPTDKRENILRALSELDVKDKTLAVMVGDRDQDANGAKMAGVAFIGVLYGYGTRTELADAGALKIAENIPMLRNMLLADG